MKGMRTTNNRFMRETACTKRVWIAGRRIPPYEPQCGTCWW